MKILSVAGLLAVTLALCSAPALAQTTPQVGGGSSQSNAAAAPNQFNVGAGESTEDVRKHYVAGRTESLAPPPGMAQSEESKGQDSGK